LSSAGKIKTKDVAVNRRTKEKRKVATIDLGHGKFSTAPGWAYNPGKTQYEPDLRSYRNGLVKEFKKEKP
jgi:hypothetical protein